jgi:hypothetical protein
MTASNWTNEAVALIQKQEKIIDDLMNMIQERKTLILTQREIIDAQDEQIRLLKAMLAEKNPD